MKMRFMSKIRRRVQYLHALKQTKYLMPKSYNEIPEYKAAFKQAIYFTRSCSFDIDAVNWIDKTFITADSTDIEDSLRDSKLASFDGAARQCLKWSHFYAPRVAKKLGCGAWVTIGQIWNREEIVYGPSWNDLKRWIAKGIQRDDFENRRGFNLHAWITLQTCEIIDLTFFTTLSEMDPQFKSCAGQLTHGRDPHAINGHRYYPMAIGSDFAQTISDKSISSLLTNNVEELNNCSAVFLFD